MRINRLTIVIIAFTLVGIASLWRGVPRAGAPDIPTVPQRGYLFASVNTDTGLRLTEAQRRLTSAEHRRGRRFLATLLDHGGLWDRQCLDALGDSPDGVENSLAVVLGDAGDGRSLRVCAAQFGLCAEQKGVLVFAADGRGADTVHDGVVPERDVASVRAALDALDVPYRTLVPTDGGLRVLVYDEGGRRRAALVQFFSRWRSSHEEIRGTGSWLGGATVEEAAQQFAALIRRERGDLPRLPGRRALPPPPFVSPVLQQE